MSHAILKRPAQGDFRVQEEHGGIIRSVIPAEDLVHAGNQAIEAIGSTLLYARVDFVRLESGQPVLMEMELIEPSLYFEQCPGSAEVFAEPPVHHQSGKITAFQMAARMQALLLYSCTREVNTRFDLRRNS